MPAMVVPGRTRLRCSEDGHFGRLTRAKARRPASTATVCKGHCASANGCGGSPFPLPVQILLWPC